MRAGRGGVRQLSVETAQSGLDLAVLDSLPGQDRDPGEIDLGDGGPDGRGRGRAHPARACAPGLARWWRPRTADEVLPRASAYGRLRRSSPGPSRFLRTGRASAERLAGRAVSIASSFVQGLVRAHDQAVLDQRRMISLTSTSIPLLASPAGRSLPGTVAEVDEVLELHQIIDPSAPGLGDGSFKAPYPFVPAKVSGFG